MTFYRRVGDVPAKRHRVHVVDGDRTHEELIGTAGFSGSSSLLYHRRPPTALVDVRRVDDPVERSVTANDPLMPWHLRTVELDDGHDLVTGRHLLVANDDVAIGVASVAGDSPLYRSVVGDELVFVAAGSARLQSPFGDLVVGAGDYVVVPAGVVHRWIVTEPVRALVVEASGHIGVPTRYLTATGQMREGAPFCERDLRAPDAPFTVADDGAEILVRTRSGTSVHTMAHHPFDVMGWDGALYPYALSIWDFEPVVGSVHQPPPVHQTFAGTGFVVCSFVPRPLDFGPDAVKVPYHHSNVDSDEVLFYVDGDFVSRTGSGIGVGSVSLHPAGFVHGPQPGSFEASQHAERTEETAVMIDTFAPLGLSAAARSVADDDYPRSWLSGGSVS